LCGIGSLSGNWIPVYQEALLHVITGLSRAAVTPCVIEKKERGSAKSHLGQCHDLHPGGFEAVAHGACGDHRGRLVAM
jgi:hypothetical protein